MVSIACERLNESASAHRHIILHKSFKFTLLFQDVGLHDGKTPRKLGLLGGTFEDGSFLLFAVPDPASFATDPDPSTPIYGG